MVKFSFEGQRSGVSGPWGNVYCFKGTLKYNTVQPSLCYKFCEILYDVSSRSNSIAYTYNQLCDEEVDPFIL